jgi:spectinomycin phosphotransferase
MIEKPFPSEQRILECLKVHYDIKVMALTRLSLGADMNAAVYKAQTHNQSAYFIKIKQGHAQDISAMIMSLLQEAGVQHIIPLIKTVEGQATQRIDDFTLTVSPFVEGQDGFNRGLTDEQWTTLGQVMRQVHDIHVPSSLQAKIRRESFSPKWRDVVRSFYPLIESEPSGDEVSVNMLKFMKENATTIHRLVGRAEQLAQKVQHQSAHFVLCHSDLHGGNVLIDAKNAIYIVDWDDPIMAPQERDLMFIGGGVANIWNQSHEEELFYQGYGKVKVNRELLAYYRHERIVEDIAVYGQQLLLTKTGGQDRITWYNDFVSQFDPQGVVEIAFKTID